MGIFLLIPLGAALLGGGIAFFAGPKGAARFVTVPVGAAVGVGAMVVVGKIVKARRDAREAEYAAITAARAATQPATTGRPIAVAV